MTWTSESPSTTPTAASWTFCRAKVHNHVHDIAGGWGVGRKSQAFWRARPALAMIIVITCDKVIEKLHLRKMIRRMWGRRRKAGEKIVQRTCRNLLVFRGSRGGLLRRLGHFGMRQHRALRREYGYLACREEAPSSGFAAEEALASAPRAFVSRLDALPGIAGNGFALPRGRRRPPRTRDFSVAVSSLHGHDGGRMGSSGFERVGGFLLFCVEWCWCAIAAFRGAGRRYRRGDSRSCHGDLHWGASHAASLGYRFWDMACSGTLLSFVVVVRGGRSLRHRIFC